MSLWVGHMLIQAAGWHLGVNPELFGFSLFLEPISCQRWRCYTFIRHYHVIHTDTWGKGERQYYYIYKKNQTYICYLTTKPCLSLTDLVTPFVPPRHDSYKSLPCKNGHTKPRLQWCPNGTVVKSSVLHSKVVGSNPATGFFFFFDDDVRLTPSGACKRWLNALRHIQVCSASVNMTCSAAGNRERCCGGTRAVSVGASILTYTACRTLKTTWSFCCCMLSN